MTDAELIAKCRALAAVGDAMARRVLQLLAELAEAQRLNTALASRVAAQSELLSRRACVPTRFEYAGELQPLPMDVDD